MKDRDSCNMKQVLFGKQRVFIMLLGDDEDTMFLSFADKLFKLLSFCFKQYVGRLPWILSSSSCESLVGTESIHVSCCLLLKANGFFSGWENGHRCCHSVELSLQFFCLFHFPIPRMWSLPTTAIRCCHSVPCSFLM